MRLDELHCVEHTAVGGGGLELDRVQQREQRGPVRAVVLIEQRQVVVAVVGRNRLVRGREIVQAAGLFQGLEHQMPGAFGGDPGRLGRRGGVRGEGGVADYRQDVAEHPEQPFGLRPVLLTQLLQVVTALLVDGSHALAEHGHHLVAGGSAGGVHQAGDESEPLVLADLAQIGDVGDLGLADEVRDLAGRHSIQPRLGRTERVESLQVRHAGLELAQRGGPRWVLEPVELAAAGNRVDQQQTGQPSPIGGGEAGGDLSEQGGVDLGADGGGHRVHRGVAG
ncbi:MAG: hypothetical protein ACRDS1_02215 [Pseudonocardiaceae bacterium]